MMRLSNIFLLGAGLLTNYFTVATAFRPQVEGGVVTERCKDDAGGNIVSADSCQELTGCQWAEVMATGGSGCVRVSTQIGEQRKLASCPSDTIATFTGLVAANSDLASIPNPYLGLTWTNGAVAGGSFPPYAGSGYKTIADASSGFAGRTGDDRFTFIITSFAPGCPWGIGTLIMTSAWYNNVNVTFNGTRASQTNCIVRSVLPSVSTVTSIDLSSCGLLTSLTMTPEGGTQAPGLGGSKGYLALSNMQIFTAPPPSPPSAQPSVSPSTNPSVSPSTQHSALPSTSPTASPSVQPSALPSNSLSASPSAQPSALPSTSLSVSPSASPSSAPKDPIVISAASHRGRDSVDLGRTYNLLVTLSLPAANGVDRHGDKHVLNRTTYALLLDVPGTGNVAYKRTSVRPYFKPVSLKNPGTQTGAKLWWPDVPMPLYANRKSTRIFKVTFKVKTGAMSPLTFVASVWKDGTKLQTTAPVQVTVTGKSA